MKTTKIQVSDYYGNKAYYLVMPQAIFNVLNAAWLNGEEYADVDKELFDEMTSEYRKLNIKGDTECRQ